MEFNFERPHWISGMADWAGIVDEIRRAPDRALATFRRFHITPSYLQTLAAPLPTGHEPYNPKILFRGKIGEVILAHWKENVTCLPYDRGPSRGLVWLASGTFEKTSYEFDRSLRLLGASQRFDSGAAFDVSPGDIHALKTFGPGISLHIHTPPFAAMKVYDLHSRTTLTLTDDCGAWIPSSENRINGRESWA